MSSSDDELISIAAAATAIGVNKSTLARDVKAGRVRSHDGKVRLSEVREDRAKNVDHSKAHRRSGAAESPATAPVASVAPDAVASPVASSDATRNGPSDATAPETDATLAAALGDLISIAAAAKAVGVNKSTLARQVQSGAVRSHDGKVRLAEVLEDRAKNIDLNKSNARPRKPKAGDDSDDLLDDPELEVLVDGKMLPFNKAQALKENYLAKLRKLEFLNKSGALVERQAADDFVFAMARDIRDAWLGWPARVATLMASELGTDERLLNETLSRYVQDHLGELGKPTDPKFTGVDGEPAVGMATRDHSAAEADGA